MNYHICKCEVNCSDAYNKNCQNNHGNICYKCPNGWTVSDLTPDLREKYYKLQKLTKKALISMIIFNK